MMRDQAQGLRSLKMETASLCADHSTRPKTIVIAGGKGGVGTSTLTANLGASLSKQGRRVMLASCSSRPHDMAIICGIEDPQAIRTDEPYQTAAGLLLIPPHLEPAGNARIRNVLRAVEQHGTSAELALIDAGSSFLMHAKPSMLTAVDALMLVTTGDNIAVMDTYSAMKDAVGKETPDECAATCLPPTALLVNRCQQAADARCIHRRIADTCHRFLQMDIAFAGEVPDDRSLCSAASATMPAVMQSPTSPAARAIHRVALTLAKTVGNAVRT